MNSHVTSQQDHARPVTDKRADERPGEHAICFRKSVPNVGEFTVRALRLPEDVPLVHDWVSRDYAHYWGMQNESMQEVEDAYREILRPPGSKVFIGQHDGAPAFLLEWYRASEDPIGRYYDVRPGDHGMHLLVAPAERAIPGFTWQVFQAVLEFMFGDDSVERIVVEPDVRNDKIHRLNRRAGFEYQQILQLSKKTAYLAFCTRERYRDALLRDQRESATDASSQPCAAAVPHLSPGVWAQVNTAHLRKILSELCHERVLQPRQRSGEGRWDAYTLATDVPGVEYRFRAQRLALDHWHIDADSIEKYVDGRRAPLDSVRFIIEVRETIGLSPAKLPTYLEEIASTLYSAAYKWVHQRFDAEQLAQAEFQDIESAMSEGHPCFVANNGRIGFDLADHGQYAPEAGADVRLVWVAAHVDRASFAAVTGLSYRELVREELGADTVAAFEDTLRRQGLDPDAYLFMPVHPWQWDNKLAPLFAAEIAAQRLVFLGRGADRYRAQQSIRTFFNLSQPHRCYVKTALSILNMGFMRGLSPYYMETTPAINEWVHALIQEDGFLRETGFTILREVASIGYRHGHFDTALPSHSPHKKMLAALWRESPVPGLRPGQRVMTMAALLHRDRDGAALLPVLIQRSGLEPRAWLRRYLRCYLSPLLHCFYAHGLVFMPHGENLILVLEDDAPVRALMKDVGEEVAIIEGEPKLPEKVRRIAVSVPEELKSLSIFTDVFDCFFRFVAEILWAHDTCSEAEFWRAVAECVSDYERAHPEYADRFRRFDLFAPEFALSCLNRLQLANNEQLLDLADPAASLQFAGMLQNPIAPYRPAERGAAGR
ncbi:GNAT family N-acetyltransferase [Haliangium sp.]|uniref:GNAT family N-acetyltransferase n=1 Tax=Haliangium sp. TaxID=2663208 RepID=UPI003D0B113F